MPARRSGVVSASHFALRPYTVRHLLVNSLGPGAFLKEDVDHQRHDAGHI